MNMAKHFNVRTWSIAALRRASYKLPQRSEALKRARVSRNTYKCSKCKHFFGRREIQLDHIVPVIPIEGIDSLDKIAERLTVESKGWQVLCKPCHRVKTNEENALRRQHKTIKKKRKKKK